MKRVLVIASLLAACGPADEAGAVIRIAWLGDSITESADVTCDVACKLCAHLNGQSCSVSGEYLNSVAASSDSDVNAGTTAGTGAVYTGATYEIVNLGDSGDQVTLEIAGRYCSQVAAAATPFDVLITMGGHNDLRSGVGGPGQVGSDGETGLLVWSGAGAASYSAMVDDACRVQGMDVVMVGVLPWQGGGGWTAGKITETIDFNTRAEAFATAGGTGGACAGRLFYVDSWSFMDQHTHPANVNGIPDNICDNCPDSIHPDNAGYVQLAQGIYDQAFAP